MFKYIIMVSIALLFAGCLKPVKEKTISPITENSLKEIVANAINGDRNYNDSLSGLIDYSLPINVNFNDLKIEKIHTPKKELFCLADRIP